MIFQWDIYVDGKFKGIVGSMTEQGAIKSWYMTCGSASRYSGIGYDQITAVKSR